VPGGFFTSTGCHKSNEANSAFDMNGNAYKYYLYGSYYFTMHITADESVSIVSLHQSHAAVLLELVNANRLHLRQWLPWVDYMQTVEDFDAFIAMSQKREAAGTDIGCMILYNDEPAGRIGIYDINRQNSIGAIGYWLGEAFSGKGIATKACRELVDYAFTTLGLNRAEIKCGTGNYPSQAIAERLGFKKEGVLRQAELLHGNYIDLYLYSMLKAEWAKG
jgi:ribosomal-protein-serine acetyltransferase